MSNKEQLFRGQPVRGRRTLHVGWMRGRRSDSWEMSFSLREMKAKRKEE